MTPLEQQVIPYTNVDCFYIFKLTNHIDPFLGSALQTPSNYLKSFLRASCVTVDYKYNLLHISFKSKQQDKHLYLIMEENDRLMYFYNFSILAVIPEETEIEILNTNITEQQIKNNTKFYLYFNDIMLT